MAKRKLQAAIYPRKSRDNASTLEGQMNACIEWCERNDVEYEIFKEEGSASSEDWNRPKLQEMLKAIENYEFDLVVVTEQTRICRDDMFPVFKNLLRETDTKFVTADNNSIFNYENPDDELKSDILQAVGKNELSRAKIRLKRGTVQAAKKGNWVGKKVPVGYEYDKSTKRLKQTNEAAVIRSMFELYLEGMSTKDIAYKFKHENVIATYLENGERKNMLWTPSGVSRMLNNVVYVGHSLFGKTMEKKIKGQRKTLKTDEEKQILIKNTHKGIITQEEWDRVQFILNDRNSRPPSLKLAKHPFSGLIKCGICGAVHSFQTNTKTGKKRISSCQTRNYSEDLSSYTVCKNSGSNLEDFEELFYSNLGRRIKKIDEYRELLKGVNTSVEKRKQDKEKVINTKLKMIQQFKSKSKKILSLIEDNFYDEEEEKEKKAEVKRLKNQVNILESEIANLEIEEEETEDKILGKISNNMKKFISGKDNPNLEGKKANEILRKIVEEIRYTTEGVGKTKQIKLIVVWKDDLTEFIGE